MVIDYEKSIKLFSINFSSAYPHQNIFLYPKNINEVQRKRLSLYGSNIGKTHQTTTAKKTSIEKNNYYALQDIDFKIIPNF